MPLPSRQLIMVKWGGRWPNERVEGNKRCNFGEFTSSATSTDRRGEFLIRLRCCRRSLHSLCVAKNTQRMWFFGISFWQVCFYYQLFMGKENQNISIIRFFKLFPLKTSATLTCWHMMQPIIGCHQPARFRMLMHLLGRWQLQISLFRFQMETHDDVNYNNEGKATVTSNEDASLCAFSNTFRSPNECGRPSYLPAWNVQRRFFEFLHTNSDFDHRCYESKFCLKCVSCWLKGETIHTLAV